ncbi:protein zyg-11 homolog B isoform X1 [Patella vulgata]|uniref:protein zyg-11 homolog B isoform X1 n=1 Tax=Patella vulgata TaxID=6465 RepID=UPI0024A80A08|nr:protein zyg-11 homolog B isoform X1 [Patella vulgata]
MYDRPVSLQDCCVDFICDNLEDLCDIQSSPESPHPKHILKDPDVFFHTSLSEQLLSTLNQKGKLNDSTIGIFQPSHTSLRRVSIKDAQLTTKGLRVFKSHKLSEVEITGLKSVTVNDLIGCLGEWTLANLRLLNVSNSTFLNSAKFCVVVSLSKLQTLQFLNVSNTEFNKHGLEIIAEDLPCLESLDISGTPINDISPLRKCKDRLKMLSMYNLMISNTEEMVSVLCELSKLVYLDVSDNSSAQPFLNYQQSKFDISQLLCRTTSHPSLSSLDISGRDDVPEDVIREYMESHRKLRFLGLALTHTCEYSMFMMESPDYRPGIVVTGEADETQLKETLKRYVSRCMYIQRALYRLFSFSQHMTEPREDIIRLVIPAMKAHPKQLGVQMAATACLYNLSKSELGPKIHPMCLRDIVELTLKAMEQFPSHQQLQKNALLTLCSDRMLQDVSFDRYRCAKLVMDCLCAFDDPSMNRMSVAICSILAAKISTEETSVLGAKSRYMKKLLGLVKQKVDNQLIDITLKFTLSALWNLTDESPPTCRVFLSEKGLELFMTTLQVVGNLETENRVQVETKILGLLNNIAEVKELRKALMREDFIMLANQLLDAEHIDVSYFAAGIVAHLASDGEETWVISGTLRIEVLEKLGQVVLNWEQPQGEMVAYRSFSPFFPLLICYDLPSVQLWAVWAINHVCTKNEKRYCPLLQEEGGVEKLQALLKNDTTPEVQKISRNILELLHKHAKSQ